MCFYVHNSYMNMSFTFNLKVYLQALLTSSKQKNKTNGHSLEYLVYRFCHILEPHDYPMNHIPRRDSQTRMISWAVIFVGDSSLFITSKLIWLVKQKVFNFILLEMNSYLVLSYMEPRSICLALSSAYYALLLYTSIYLILSSAYYALLLPTSICLTLS